MDPWVRDRTLWTVVRWLLLAGLALAMLNLIGAVGGSGASPIVALVNLGVLVFVWWCVGEGR